MLSDGVLRLRQIGSEVGGIAFQESRQRYVQVVADPQQCADSWQTLSDHLVINGALRYPRARAKASRLPSATASTQARKFAVNTVLKEELFRRGACASSPPIDLACHSATSFSSESHAGCSDTMSALSSPSHAWHREQ